MTTSRFNKSNRDQNPDFNLDEYIREKSGAEERPKANPEAKEQKSSFFKNTLIMTGFVVISLLYFNNWNPIQMYGNIFGAANQQAVAEPIQVSPDVRVLNNPVLSSEVIASLEGLKNLESLESLQNLEGLENSLAVLENMEEMNELRSFALEAAMEALSGISESGNFGSEVQAEIQEALRELESIQNAEPAVMEAESPAAESLTSSVTQYSAELNELGLGERFTESEIQKLHEANVPASVLKQLDELNLLEKLNIDSILEAYNSEN